MLLAGFAFRLFGDMDAFYYFIGLGLYFDLKAHLYRIQDNA